MPPFQSTAMQQENLVEVPEKETGKQQESLTPHDHDVLCGRGGNINTHPGNEAFRNYVERRKKVYLTARFKREKRIITDSIIDEIKSRDPPGRFLSLDSKSKLWYDIGMEKARDKTSQALRENAPKIRKEIERENEALRKKEADRIDYSRRYDPHEHLHEDEQMRGSGRYDVPYDQYASPHVQTPHAQTYNHNEQYSDYDTYGQGHGKGFIRNSHPQNEQNHYSVPDRNESSRGYKEMSYFDVPNAVMDTVISHFGCPSYLSQKSDSNREYYKSEQVHSSGDVFNNMPPRCASSAPTPARVPSPSFFPVQQENGKRAIQGYGDGINSNKSRKHDKEQYPRGRHNSQYNRQYESEYNEELRLPKTYYPDGREAHNTSNERMRQQSPVFRRLPSSGYIPTHTISKDIYHEGRQKNSEKYREYGYEERDNRSHWGNYDRSNVSQKMQKQDKSSVWKTFFSCDDERAFEPQPYDRSVKSDIPLSTGWEEEGQEVDLNTYEGSMGLDGNIQMKDTEERCPPPKNENGINFDWTSGCQVFASMHDMIGIANDKEPSSSVLSRNDSMDLDSLSYTGSLNGKRINDMFDDDKAADGPIPIIGKEESEGTMMSLGDSLLSINFSNESFSALNKILSN